MPPRFRNIRTIGLISDTHGLLRPEAVELLRGSDLILHAGDIGPRAGRDAEAGAAILDGLRALAPLVAIRGNNDTGAWAEPLPERETVDVDGSIIRIVHDLKGLGPDPAAAGIRCVLAGHSHRPGISEKDGVLFVNPGSAGPRRFSLPVTVGRIRIRNGKWSPEILPLPS